MSEQAKQMDGGPDLSGLGDASNILVLAPSLGGRGTEACSHLLTRTPPDRTSVLAITYTESPQEFAGRWTESAGGPPTRGGIVSAGESDATVDDPNWAVRPVETPSDLTGVGIELSELLSGMADTGDGESVVVCFNSVTTLLQYADLERAFRFLHVVTGRVKTAGGVGHYHVDPGAHDQQTLATLKGLFDAVVEVDEDGTWSVQR